MRGDMQVRFGGRYGKTYCRKAVRRSVPSLRLGKGGDIVSLAMQMHGTDSVSYVLNAIESNTPNIKPLSFSFRQRESFDSFEDITVKPLENTALLRFLAERQIPASLAGQACQEVYYKHNGKPYFAIAFGNEQGGYELRYPN